MSPWVELFTNWTDSKPIIALISCAVGLLGGVLSTTLSPFAKAFSEVKGHNLAILQDIDQLRQQLRENTEITKSIDQSYTRDDYLWKAELNYREQQLSKFYGPAYGYLMSQRDIFGLWFDQKMQEVNHEVKKLLSQQNALLRDLIIENAHLIEGSSMPDSFVRFCASTLVFDLYATPTFDGYVPEQLRADPRASYPHEFEQHVVQVTESLKARIETLHANYAKPLEAR